MAEGSDSNEVVGRTVADMEATPQGKVRRWLAEIAMAERAEKTWREEAKEVIKTYEAGKTKPNAFNILWSNTDTLAPAIYNSTPVPDVRRRFRDADPVGKAGATIIERTLSYELDQFDHDKIAKDAVLDMLTVGRGVVRVKYSPVIQSEPAGGVPTSPLSAGEQAAPVTPDGAPPPVETLLDETAPWEHVQWDDFRRGPGKRWDDIPWVAFKHAFTYEMAVEAFGAAVAAKLEFQDAEHSEELTDRDTRQMFKTACVWEIWDKDQRRCLFVAECYKDAPCKEVDDPLKLVGFFPLPRPAYAVEQSGSLVPIPLYRLYKEQAKELDRVSARINKVVDALKVRGAYMADQSDLEKIIEATDNQMVPINNLSGVAALGGLDKAIWIMPIDKLINVLNGLYLAREQIKGTIYEITGISDIVRGSTQASESATAQRLKSEWGSMRLQKMQKEVQRLLRDCMRIQSEIFVMRYSQQRFAQVTGIQLPTMQQKQQAQMAMQQQALMAQARPPMPQQPGQPPPQAPQPDPALMEMMQKPTWEEIMAMLQADGLRSCRIDIETDSTVAETVNRDMMGLAEVTEAIGQLIAGAAPAVQTGMLPVEVVKEFAMTISRRARMGLAVEDALEKIQQPPPQIPPEQMKQIEAGKQEMEKGKAEITDGKMQLAEQQNQMLQQQLDFVGNQAKQAMAEAQKNAKLAGEATQQMAERGPPDQVFETLLAQLMESQQQTQMLVQQSMATIQATLQMATEQSQATSQAVMQSMAATAAAVAAPRQVQIQRDKNGSPIGATSVIKH